MTFTYSESDVHLRDDAGRELSVRATRDLMDALSRHVRRPVKLVVDLGCGTGRFTVALSETFQAPVIGIEPAANTRASAQAKPHPASVRFVDGTANDIPLPDGSIDLVFMSQVFHHVIDPEGAFGEIHRILFPGGCLAMRQTTLENLDSYFYQRFFPEARAVDERRLPAREPLLKLARSCGFRVAGVEVTRYEIAANGADYAAKIAIRA